MTRRRPSAMAAVAGLAAGAVTLGVASLSAAIVSPTSDPLVAIGGEFIDATPAWLKDLAISAFGTADKTALTVGMVVVVAALAALAGVLARRRWAAGATLVVTLGLVAGLAAAVRPGAGALAPVPSFLGAVAGLATLRWLVSRIPDDVDEDEDDEPTRADSTDPSRRALRSSDALAARPDRRTFLLTAGLVTLGGALAALGGRALGAGQRAVDAVRSTLQLPAASRTAPLPSGVDVTVDGATVPDLDPWVTPSDDFYRIDTALVVPQIDPDTWELRVHGLVDREVTLTFADLLTSDLVEAWVTLACVSNEVGGDLVGNAKWLGLPVRELLARAGPQAGADMVLSTSADGFTASTPLEVLTDERDALLAVGMNDAPLPVEHGFPVRMVVPGLYGYVSATKWVVDLEVTRFADAEAYWTTRGWSERGPVKTQSRIEVPRPDATVAAGRTVVAGTAWAQHRGVRGVEVRVDGGPWQEAMLAADGGIDSWRQWSWVWDVEPGDYELEVRASDPDGPQTEAETGVVPDGATGLDTLRVHVETA